MTKYCLRMLALGLGSCFFVFGLVTTASCFAEDVKDPEYTNRREVMQDETLRRDFNLQGEYVLEKTDQMPKWGLQLIADGDGKFRFVVYFGGLPGDGWKTGEGRMLGTATVLEDNQMEFQVTKAIGPDGKETTVDENHKLFKCEYEMTAPQRPTDGGNNAANMGGQRNRFWGPTVTLKAGKPHMFEVKKIVRRSPTLGEKAPEGAKVIFDGSNTEMFEKGAKLNESQRPGGNTLWSDAATKPFEQKPYHLHLEFLTSYMPKSHGQARSNSGVYIDEAYECQVLDSFGLELANNECGGFYSIKAPDINASFPPLTWQTYDIDFTPPKYDGDKKIKNARLTLKQNGIMIHDDIELPHGTPGRKPEANEPRGIYLQGHGNNVQYRNIWIEYKD